MATKRFRQNRPFNLNEIIEELDSTDKDALLPSFVAIFPPENANAEVTDEDSGDEEVVTWHNLPGNNFYGSQLRAQADLIYSDDEMIDSEDELPLSTLPKRQCTDTASGDQEVVGIADPTEPIPGTSATISSYQLLITPSVSSNQKYQWRGTIRENRTSHCPLPLKKEMKKTDRGTYRYKISRPADILVCKWNDNSVVTVASNTEQIEPIHNAKRFSQQLKKYVMIEQPHIIKKYNENMGGVDQADQNVGLYRTAIRGKKLYFPLLCHCLDMATQNAWHLYKSDGGESDHLTYRRRVARSLLETYKITEKRGPRSTSKIFLETSRFDSLDHLVEYKENQLRCAVCKKKTNYCYQKCTVSFHPKACFASYHTPV